MKLIENILTILLCISICLIGVYLYTVHGNTPDPIYSPSFNIEVDNTNSWPFFL